MNISEKAIKAYQDNDVAFSLMTEGWQNDFKKIGKENFQYLHQCGEWRKCKSDKFYLSLTYQLNEDYHPEPIIKCGIKIETVAGGILGIPFGDKQLLYYKSKWLVGDSCESDYVDCKLVACKRLELKAGDIAYNTDLRYVDSSDIGLYCLILDERYYMTISDDDITRYSGQYCYWYKVERI